MYIRPLVFLITYVAMVGVIHNAGADATVRTARGGVELIKPLHGLHTKTELGAVFFRSDSATLEQALWPLLRGTVALAMSRPDLDIELEGHADVRGSRNHNHSLSVKRVESVTKFLIGNGIAPHRIKARAYGETRASTNVQDSRGHIFDRRVTITLVPAGSSV